MGIGWGLGYNKCLKDWLRAGLSYRSFNILSLWVFVSSWIGAKTFFLIFSARDKLGVYSKELNFWFGGGFVFYGGLIFGLITAILYLKIKKEHKFQDLSLLGPGLVLGHAVGRLGCFLAGCCYGSVCHLGQHISFLAFVERYPVQLMEAMGLFGIYFILTNELKKREESERAIYLYFFCYSVLRFFLEFLRGDGIRGIYYGLATSQWVSLLLVAVVGCFSLMRKANIKA